MTHQKFCFFLVLWHLEDMKNGLDLQFWVLVLTKSLNILKKLLNNN